MKKLIIGVLLLLPLTNAIATTKSVSMAFTKKDANDDGGIVGITTSISYVTSSTTDLLDITYGDDKRARKLAELVDGNMDNLVRDMSLGKGEVLSTLAAVWEMSAEDGVKFNGLVQEKFPEIFTSADITSQALLKNLNTLVSKDESLAKYALLS